MIALGARLVLCSLLVTPALIAQGRPLTGTLLEPGGLRPLSNATITIDGVRVTTDAQGRFQLMRPPGDSLRLDILRIGMATQRLAISLGDSPATLNLEVPTSGANPIVTLRSSGGTGDRVRVNGAIRQATTSVVVVAPGRNRFVISALEDDRELCRFERDVQPGDRQCWICNRVSGAVERCDANTPG